MLKRLAWTSLVLWMGMAAFKRKDALAMPSVLLLVGLTKPTIFRWLFGEVEPRPEARQPDRRAG